MTYDPFRGYDQWKTASPWDEVTDPSDFYVDEPMTGEDMDCPACKMDTATWYENYEEPGINNDLIAPELVQSGWHCPNCDWAQPAEEEDYERTKKRRESIVKLENEIEYAYTEAQKRVEQTTIDELFAYAPDGEFSWNDQEAGDWHVFNCGERDCSQQWHKIAYSVSISRKDGKRSIETSSVDEDGNWDVTNAWEDGDPQEHLSELLNSISTQSIDYFHGWAQYFCYVARTGNDVLGELHTNTFDNAIKAAQDNFLYLIK